uniref:Uncharacterized protein n=1 Tax=Cacopsylla melanoneura TaxID=428564 RepID=A0A8D8XF84_9HEMI
MDGINSNLYLIKLIIYFVRSNFLSFHWPIFSFLFKTRYLIIKFVKLLKLLSEHVHVPCPHLQDCSISTNNLFNKGKRTLIVLCESQINHPSCKIEYVYSIIAEPEP